MTREEKQRMYAEVAYNKSKGLLYLFPRFGKIATSVYLFQNFLAPKVLIAYPLKDIQDSWEKEFERLDYSNPNITYTTHLSLHKYKEEKFDVIIIDEIHLLSDAQLIVLCEIEKNNKMVIGLTGTLNVETEADLKDCNIPVIAKYSLIEAIKDGVVVDYQINVVRIPLDDKRLIQYKKKKTTEKQQFNAYTSVITKLQSQGRDTKFLALARMRIIQNSLAKLEYTRKLLKRFENERVLVFCGLIKIAEQLGIPVQHSKSEDNLTSFKEGQGNHLAVCKMGNTGVTFKPLNRVIINYTDSNAENLTQKISRCIAVEFLNPDKKADIWIISSNEEVEKRWINKALTFFDEAKINYI